MALPERTCIGCRKQETRRGLLRFRVDGRGHLHLDALQRMPGRGVYVCPTRRCIAEAARRSGFARSLRRGVAVVNTEGVVMEAVAEVRAQADRLSTLALRDGRAIRGVGGAVRVVEPRLLERLALLEEQSRRLQSSRD
jgi:uncharacterized protein